MRVNAIVNLSVAKIATKMRREYSKFHILIVLCVLKELKKMNFIFAAIEISIVTFHAAKIALKNGKKLKSTKIKRNASTTMK